MNEDTTEKGLNIMVEEKTMKDSLTLRLDARLRCRGGFIR